MQEESFNPALPSVLKKLGTMTAIRDSLLVEQSLLRTLGSILGVARTSFYHTADNGEVIRALHHSFESKFEDEAKYLNEKIEEVTNEKNVSTDLLDLFESAGQIKMPCGRKIDDVWTNCYPVYGNKHLLGFFVFQGEKNISVTQDAIIQGVLEVFINFSDLLNVSQRDQLTGLLNRSSLDANLGRLWSLMEANTDKYRGSRSEEKKNAEYYWIGMLDIDHFKKINDTYGHMIGDEVLIVATRLLQSSFRQADLLFRYGGEEFMVIISAVDLASATMAFERIRSKIELFQFPQVGNITISAGFSRADPHVLPQEAIHRADSSLYAAKTAGRNRVCFYDNLLNEGILKETPTGTVEMF
jgi:diguanylate cyclase (GGDEF)-like protein